TVHSEELFFECHQQRVAFIDIAALLGDIRQGMETKGQLLRTNWQVNDITSPVGAFRLRYTLERERGLLDVIGGEGSPENSGNYRYGLSEWQVEPVVPDRGESVQAALAPGSEFRQIVDTLDPSLTAVTFWV